MSACDDPQRACPGFTLFAPHFEQNRTVYLIDFQGEVIHTWEMPYTPGLSGYLTDGGMLLYNGRTTERSFLSRFPFKGGVVLEAGWDGRILWEVRHPDHHHDGIRLRNGNVLLHCLGRAPDAIAQRVAGGTADRPLPSALYAPQPEADAGAMYADYLDLSIYFLRLGALGFGGPIALAGSMKRDLEEERHWVTRDEFQDGLAIAQTMPGPLAAQLAMWIGFIG